ncbi:quercetin 2,3-dioxygenase [Alkalilimnicola ehrlichii]|uniref:Quercetin 2,3-dioxygenase n=1 Tax=Alkalilimnicola ehrlichii TaxID=351052 RepID=A0A3E0X234_9GAMM|nr:pirin family protein [Alkalilimnicola ehrlichii]RFA30806.1 quercetin 2,3-dioxygenase [Alkalilimnicola ehrlichii]RFA38382.1 quercetin 2,3-dioxygenase [Alkalilimnicola ehrlichii]
MKAITEVLREANGHWVGDGFPVRSLFSYQSHPRAMSPFLLLDYAGPREFEPANQPRGVGPHPHRGFETVTIVYRGEVAHRDTAGHGELIGPGDVQWMTAGKGILHEEFHGQAFTEAGGTLEMVQLWVNLPARDKGVEPGYQAIANGQIPAVTLPDDAGVLRVIAGKYADRVGPARTFTPMHVWDLRLETGAGTELELPDGWTGGIVVLHGTVLVNDSEILREAEVAVLDRSGTSVRLEANNEARLLVLSGEPIDEPLAGYGPFVMNTHEEIDQALKDLRSGRFGSLRD